VAMTQFQKKNVLINNKNLIFSIQKITNFENNLV
jgi:hypothetical protein